MTSSDGSKSRYSRRFIWLAAFILLLFGGYSAGWFYLAGRLERSVAAALAALNQGGATADCVNAHARGFPFRLGIFCDGIGYSDADGSVVAAAGSLRSAAQIYRPQLLVAELDPPLRVAAEGLPPLWVDWDALRGSMRVDRPLPQRVSMAAEGLSMQTDPEEGQPEPLASATNAELHLRPNGSDVDGAFRFSGLQLDPAAVGGRTLPPLSGSGDATLKDGVAQLSSGRADLRDRSFEIRNLELTSGAGGLSISGPVSVDPAGLIDAQLTVRIQNPQDIAEALSTAFPEAADQIRTGFAGLSFLGTPSALPLRIEKGEARLGFIRLGRIPPL